MVSAEGFSSNGKCLSPLFRKISNNFRYNGSSCKSYLLAATLLSVSQKRPTQTTHVEAITTQKKGTQNHINMKTKETKERKRKNTHGDHIHTQTTNVRKNKSTPREHMCRENTDFAKNCRLLNCELNKAKGSGSANIYIICRDRPHHSMDGFSFHMLTHILEQK